MGADNRVLCNLFSKIRLYMAYIIFGILTTIIGLVIYKLLLVLNVNYIISSIMSFLLAIIFAFFTNRKYVFQCGENVQVEFVKFFSVRIAGLVINVIGLFMLADIFGLDKFISQVYMNIFIMSINYVGSKYFAFRKKATNN